MAKTLYRLLTVLVMLLGWQAISASRVVDPHFLPPPTVVLPLVVTLLHDRSFLDAAGLTLTEFVVGFALVAVVGTLLGLVMGRSRRARSLLDPLVNGLFSFPKIMLLPLFIFAFGIGFEEKVAFGFFGGVWFLIINVSVGMRAVEPATERMAVSLGARPWQLWRTVYIPSIVPLLFAGLRASVVFVFIGVLVAEMTISSGGVGKLLMHDSELGNVSDTMAIVVLVAVVSILLNASMETYQRRLDRWRGARWSSGGTAHW